MQPLDRARLNYIRIQIISACDRKARKRSEINWYNQMQLWMLSAIESQYLLNLFIESNSRRMILITNTLALGLISAETLGVPRANTDRRDAQDLQLYVHTSVSDTQRASSESWNHSRKGVAFGKMRLAKPPSEIMGNSGVRGTRCAVDITA